MSSNNRDNNSTNSGNNNNLPISVSRSTDTNETNNETNNDEQMESPPPAVDLGAADSMQFAGMGTIQRDGDPSDDYNDDLLPSGSQGIMYARGRIITCTSHAAIPRPPANNKEVNAPEPEEQGNLSNIAEPTRRITRAAMRDSALGMEEHRENSQGEDMAPVAEEAANAVPQGEQLGAGVPQGEQLGVEDAVPTLKTCDTCSRNQWYGIYDECTTCRMCEDMGLNAVLFEAPADNNAANGAGSAIVANNPAPLGVQPGANPINIHQQDVMIHPFEAHNYVNLQGVYDDPPPLGLQPGPVEANDPPPLGLQQGAPQLGAGNAVMPQADLPLGAGNVAQPNQGGAVPQLEGLDAGAADGNVVQLQLGDVEQIDNEEGGAQVFDQDVTVTLAQSCGFPPGSSITNAANLGYLGSQGNGLSALYADIPRGPGGELVHLVTISMMVSFVETNFGLAAKNNITVVPLMNSLGWGEGVQYAANVGLIGCVYWNENNNSYSIYDQHGVYFRDWPSFCQSGYNVPPLTEITCPDVREMIRYAMTRACPAGTVITQADSKYVMPDGTVYNTITSFKAAASNINGLDIARPQEQLRLYWATLKNHLISLPLSTVMSNDQIYQALLSIANEIECISGYHDNGAIFCRTKNTWLKKFQPIDPKNLTYQQRVVCTATFRHPNFLATLVESVRGLNVRGQFNRDNATVERLQTSINNAGINLGTQTYPVIPAAITNGINPPLPLLPLLPGQVADEPQEQEAAEPLAQVDQADAQVEAQAAEEDPVEVIPI